MSNYTLAERNQNYMLRIAKKFQLPVLFGTRRFVAVPKKDISGQYTMPEKLTPHFPSSFFKIHFRITAGSWRGGYESPDLRASLVTSQMFDYPLF
jgi:hypothetical protein